MKPKMRLSLVGVFEVTVTGGGDYSEVEYLVENQDCGDVRVLRQAFEHLKIKPAAHPPVCYIHHDDHWERTQFHD